MRRRPQFLLAGALLLAVLVLAVLDQRSRSVTAGGNRGVCCPLLSLPDGCVPGTGTNGAIGNTNARAGTNQF
jgi:hypothetical protein